MTFKTKSGSEVGGELTEPSGTGEAPSVVLIQEWWGINDHIRSLADRLAFLVVAPDLYHGKVAKDASEAGAMMTALDTFEAVKEIGGAVSFLKEHARGNGKVGVIDFCMGGALAFASPCHVEGLSAVVPFYGIPPAEKVDYSKVTAPILAHFAKNDDWATVAKARSSRRSSMLSANRCSSTSTMRATRSSTTRVPTPTTRRARSSRGSARSTS